MNTTRIGRLLAFLPPLLTSTAVLAASAPAPDEDGYIALHCSDGRPPSGRCCRRPGAGR